MKTNFSEFFSFDSCGFIFFIFIQTISSSTGIFLWSESPSCNFTEELQLYRTTAASRQLINECDQEIRQVKNQITSNSRAKNKVTKPVKQLSRFFKWLQWVVLGELQVPNALQYRFKIFSSATRMNNGQNSVCFFISLICRCLEIKHSLKM